MSAREYKGSCVRQELWKAFHNPCFWVSVLAGVVLAVWGIAHNTRFLYSLMGSTRWAAENQIPISSSLEGASLFIAWIAVDGMGFAAGLLYFIWPLLCALPYGYSAVQERKSGVNNQIAIRCGKKRYFYGKFLAVFLSGGVVFAVPVVGNLLGNALICPDILPCVAEDMVMLFNRNFLSELYYTYPWVFALAWSGIDFVFGGCGACLSFLCSTRCRFPFLAVVVPFVFLQAVNYLAAFAANLTGSVYLLSPLRMPKPSTYLHNPGWLLLSGCIVLAGIGWIAGYLQVVKHENL